MKAKRSNPEVVIHNGKPVKVILDIREYEQLLERAEDIEDLNALRAVRQKPLKFRRLDEFLKEYSPDV